MKKQTILIDVNEGEQLPKVEIKFNIKKQLSPEDRRDIFLKNVIDRHTNMKDWIKIMDGYREIEVINGTSRSDEAHQRRRQILYQIQKLGKEFQSI